RSAPVLSSTVEAHPFAVDDGFEIAAGLAGVGDGARLVFSGAPPRLWLNLDARCDRNDGRQRPRWSTGRFNEKLGNIDPAHVLIGAKRGRRLARRLAVMWAVPRGVEHHHVPPHVTETDQNRPAAGV